MMRLIGRLLKSSEGTAALEFALVGPVLLMLIVVIPAGAVVLWARGVVELAASQTARCTAIGVTACTNDPTTYATNVIRDWGMAGIVSSVSAVSTAKTTCSNATGLYSSVTVTGIAGIGGSSTMPFTSVTLTASACYPSGT